MIMSQQETNHLTFHGVVKGGIEKFSDMMIPGRAKLSDAPADWPDVIHPGSLNVLIPDNGFPAEFLNRCQGELIQKLDCGCFVPAFVIPSAAITNNEVRPTNDNPRRGDAQVWRAQIHNLDNGRSVACWVLRRIGSGIRQQIELVASGRLRDKIGLVDGTRVTVELQGDWRNN